MLYSLRCIVQLPAVCHSESCTNHVTKLAIILVVYYSPLYMPYLTRSHTWYVLLTIILATSTLIDIVLVTVYCTTSQCLCHSQSCANHFKARHHTRRVLLAIVLTTSILITILLIVVMLIALCSSHFAHRVVLLTSYSMHRALHVVRIVLCSTCCVLFANVPLFLRVVW